MKNIMKIRYKGKIYHVHWPKRFDLIIFKAAKRASKRSDGTVKWMEAEADGMLNGLPVFLSLHNISQRYSFLRNSKKPEFKKRVIEKNRKYAKLPISTKGTLKKRKLFAKVLPEELKKKYGWKPRSIWTEKQKELLLKLSEEYRKSKVTIDWKKLGQDKRIEKLPFQGSFKLCKYYNSLKRKKRGGEKYVKKRREEALNYKYENYSTYRSNQDKRRIQIQNSVNEFLLSKLELR